MRNQEPKDITCKKIAWTVRNFSTLKIDARHYSEAFTICNCARILFIHKGKFDLKSLAISLETADTSSLPHGWSIFTAFSITVVNQVSKKLSVTKEDTQAVEFCADSYRWGWNIFMALSELEDPSSGYILNDKCIVEVELYPVKIEGIEPTSCPKDDDVVDFKDLGKIDKSFVPLLEDVCSWHPSLLDCAKNKSRRFTEWVFTTLGRVLQFLKDKKWKDMMNKEETREELQHLWEELEMIRIDLSWLEPLVKSALNMKGYAEKVEKVKKLKQNLAVVETEMNMIKEKLAHTEQSVEMTRKNLVNAEEDFEEKDLDAKIGYRKP